MFEQLYATTDHALSVRVTRFAQRYYVMQAVIDLVTLSREIMELDTRGDGAVLTAPGAFSELFSPIFRWGYAKSPATAEAFLIRPQYVV